MDKVWTTRESLTVWSSSGGWYVGSLESIWSWYTWPSTSIHSTASQDGPVRYLIHCLSLRQSNTGWPSCGWPHTSTTLLSYFHGRQPVAQTSVCVSCVDTCRTPFWSSTSDMYPTLSAISVTLLYPRRLWRQDTSAPQLKRGGSSKSAAVYLPPPAR